TCAAEFTQVAAIEALGDRTGAVDAMVEEYRKRRELFVPGLNRIPGFRCLPPQGAFYAWVNLEETGLSAEKLQASLLEQGGGAGGDRCAAATDRASTDACASRSPAPRSTTTIPTPPSPTMPTWTRWPRRPAKGPYFACATTIPNSWPPPRRCSPTPTTSSSPN